MTKVMIVQLSDIHIKTDQDPVLARGQAIVDAIKNLQYDLDQVVIAMTGDLAYSGQEDQYLSGWSLLEDIRERLCEYLSEQRPESSVRVDIVAIPGNHDCDFYADASIRDLVRDAVISSDSGLPDNPMVDVCTSVQDRFFEAMSLGNLGIGSPIGAVHQRLAYEYNVPVGARNLRILCFNSAWLSVLHEQQGTLLLPPAVVPDTRNPTDDVVIALFHHPYNWMPSNQARAFRKRVEAMADIILTGHEHDATSSRQQTASGERNLYIEGGALQTSDDPSWSMFNCLILDIAQRKQKLARFEWDGTSYLLKEGANPLGDAFGLVWEEFQVTRLKRHGEFALNDETRQQLDDPGATIIHKSRGPLTLPDVFVYPDLIEAHYQTADRGRVIRGASVRALFIESQRIVVVGESESGKTTLCKRVFADLLAEGYVPVMVDASRRPPRGDRLHSFLVRKFEEQYGTSASNSYKQLDRSRRVILVDDFHRLDLGLRPRQEFLEGISSFAGKVVIFSDSLSQDVSDLFEPGYQPTTLGSYSTYRILPFGKLKRNELVEKWLLLDGIEASEPSRYAYRREELTKILDNLAGRNFLPPYPAFILSVLMGAEALTPLDSQISSYGAYYELFIRAALARGRTPVQSGFILNYLAHLSHRMFEKGKKEISLEEFQDIHGDFENRFEIKKSPISLLSDLSDCGILYQSGDGVKFRHNYVYYYFCAAWLRDHITEEEIRSEIQTICRHLHIEAYSGILLFLVHLSKDPFILQELLTAAREIHADESPATFIDEVEFLMDSYSDASRKRYVDTDVDENRRKMLELVDNHVPDYSDDATEEYYPAPVEENHTDSHDAAIQFIMALRTVEILGQILKNFPGSLEGDTKFDIARECYSLGLRSIASLFGAFRSVESEVRETAEENIRRADPSLTTLQVEQRARNMLVAISEALATALVRFISTAVGSPDLDQTYRRIREESDTPAILIVDASIRIGTNTEFPHATVIDLAKKLHNRTFARAVLATLVVTHFRLFPVPMDKKQRVCAALGVEYAGVAGSSPAKRIGS